MADGAAIAPAKAAPDLLAEAEVALGRW